MNKNYPTTAPTSAAHLEGAKCLLIVVATLVTLLLLPRNGTIWIVGGFFVKQGDWPSFVTMKKIHKVRPARNESGHGECGGVIIGEKSILTAKHCVDYVNDDYKINIKHGISGFNNWSLFAKDERYFRATVVCTSRGRPRAYKLRPHRTYDYAIVRLQNKLSFDNKVLQKALLPERELRYDEQAFVVGAGEEGAGLDSFSSGVKKLPVKRVDCLRKDRHASNICFQANYHYIPGDSCKGDSGGPVYAVIDDRQYLYGLTSYGHDECHPGVSGVGVYVDVFSQRDNIRALMGECEKRDPTN